ncbi:MAG: hypothetical protein CTY35_00520 [Methylotenera sp.]|uniref:ankyrin repeat domain-containing protein n=1 Tax=Methylotenera sp. TaxID=2051956 RepID=UPI000D4F3BA4|nr:ankyrin repeat domain-containing protein [Methylotenera sp.]PPC84839.1 MAG: hypothetical protein CTY38_00515 [Methylotenera sp.]PPD02199.1 MAG: hypothetical protein CTY35_00520 [Methylotenera sp.]
MQAIETGKISTIDILVIIRMIADVYCPEEYAPSNFDGKRALFVQDGSVMKNQEGNLTYYFSHDDGGSYVPNEFEDIGFDTKVTHTTGDEANDVYECKIQLPQGAFIMHQNNIMVSTDDEGGLELQPSLFIASFDKSNVMYDINLQDQSGCTLLHYAVKSNQSYAVKYLLEHGADQTIADYHSRLPIEPHHLTSEDREAIQDLLLADRAKKLIEQNQSSNKTRGMRL